MIQDQGVNLGEKNYKIVPPAIEILRMKRSADLKFLLDILLLISKSMELILDFNVIPFPIYKHFEPKQISINQFIYSMYKKALRLITIQ